VFIAITAITRSGCHAGKTTASIAPQLLPHEDALFDAQSIQDIDQDLGASSIVILLPERIRLTHAGWIDKDDAVSGSEVLVLVAQQPSPAS